VVIWFLALLAVLGLAVAGVFALERMLVYPFDATQVAPEELGLPTANVIRYTKGGRDLVIWTSPAAGGKPTLFYLHGNAGNLANRAPHFGAFAEMGFGIVAPAYRGSSGSKGWPHQRAILGDMEAIYRDLLSGALTGEPVRPVLYGESLGTAVATHLNARLAPADRPAAIVLEAPLASIGEVAGHVQPRLQFLTGIMPSPWRSIDQAGALTGPLLILHGSDDPLIPIAQGRALFEAAPSDEKLFHEAPGAGHSDVIQGDALDVLLAFLNRF
jgi:pimeloyl-ACP methyl ester carboxylesterase